MADRAREDLDEGAFAGAVLTEQRVHLAGAGGELGFAQRDNAAVAFRQACGGDEVHRYLAPVTRCLPADYPPGGKGQERPYLVPAASAAVISTQSGVIGNVRP